MRRDPQAEPAADEDEVRPVGDGVQKGLLQVLADELAGLLPVDRVPGDEGPHGVEAQVVAQPAVHQVIDELRPPQIEGQDVLGVLPLGAQGVRQGPRDVLDPADDVVRRGQALQRVFGDEVQQQLAFGLGQLGLGGVDGLEHPCVTLGRGIGGEAFKVEEQPCAEDAEGEPVVVLTPGGHAPRGALGRNRPADRGLGPHRTAQFDGPLEAAESQGLGTEVLVEEEGVEVHAPVQDLSLVQQVQPCGDAP